MSENEIVVDEPNDETTDPYASLDVVEGVGFHDDEVTETESYEPDLDNEDEPTVDEPQEGVVA